ncbi:hypothetical protein MMC10_002216 [Thelotrema lepadinum]|nr:hypothetical protein [Thelotrema lepadinum]
MAPSRAFSSTLTPFCSRSSPLLRNDFIPSSYQRPAVVPINHTRRVATSRRTTKALRPTPWPSAVAGSKYLKSNVPTVVFNPPPTAPTPYQTPPLFLPPNDNRRSTLAEAYEYSNPYASGSRPLPPLVEEPRQKTYNVTAEQIAEIRKLRSSDPFTWTRKKLAEKYGCTEFFISLCSPAPQEKLDAEKRKQDEVKSQWGKRRRGAREDRQKRRILIQRDQ